MNEKKKSKKWKYSSFLMLIVREIKELIMVYL